MVTRGDANEAAERWVLPADARTRRMVARIPWAGYALVWLASPPFGSRSRWPELPSWPRWASAGCGGAADVLAAAAPCRPCWD